MRKTNNEFCKRYRYKKSYEKLLLSVPFAMRPILRLRSKWTFEELDGKKKIIEELEGFKYNLNFKTPDFRLADEVLSAIKTKDDFNGLFYAFLFRGLQLGLLPPLAKIFCKRLDRAEDLKIIFLKLCQISNLGQWLEVRKPLKQLILRLEKGIF